MNTTTHVAQIRKQLSMLRAAQRRLGSTGRLVNAGRIRATEAELESVEMYLSIIARDGGYYADNGEFVVVA